jgi:hypothetical protein
MATRTDPAPLLDRLGAAADPRDAIAARLRRLAAAARQAPEVPELQEVAEIFERVAAGDARLDELVDLGPSVGGEAFQAWARRRSRDRAYRALAAAVCPGAPIRSAAAIVVALVSRYEATRWRQDRRAGAPPADADEERMALFTILRAGRVVDTRQLARILRTGDPSQSWP